MTDKQIDLLVRANVQGKKDLDGVAKSIASISSALDDQSAAAKRGVKNLDEIQGSLAALAQENVTLGQSLKLLKDFDALPGKIDKTSSAVDKAKAAYETYRKELSTTTDVTDKQQAKQNALSKTYENAQARLAKLQAEQSAMATSLREMGLASDDVAGSQARVQAALEATAAVTAKARAIEASYANDVRAARDADATARAASLQQATEEANKRSVINAQIAAASKRAADAQAADAKKVADAQAAQVAKQNALIASSEAQAAKVRDANAAFAADNAKIAAEEKANAASKAASDAKAQAAAIAKQNALIASSEALAAKTRDANAAFAAENALQKVADDAEKATRAYTTLATASSNLKPQVTSLRDAVNSILNPGQELRKTLEGVEGEVSALSTTITQIKGPVSDYRGLLEKLESAQKAIGKQSGMVDEFKRQNAALKVAKTEFDKARTAVTQYAAEVRKGGSEGQGFVDALGRAQAAARAAATALAQQESATHAAANALRAAGIDANNLAAAEARLTAAATSTVQTTQRAADAVRQYGTASEETAQKRGKLFGGDGERTTLGLIQRIRGEILALTASYVGLFGAVSAAKGAIDATNAREGGKNQLALSVGNDKAAIDAEYAYVKGQSDRIGTEFEKTIKGYAKFSAAATLAGRGRQEVRYIFEAFTEVGRVANLSADDIDGVYKALEQVFSKGKIQSEELRGQLGDRLFGAFEIAAKALKSTYPDLEKAMKNGEVTSNQLVLIAQEYRRIVAEELPAATQSLAAQQMRMNNAVFDFKLAVADAGWADAYKQALIVLTDFMKSTDGQDAAKGFARALTQLANIFVYLVQNIETVKNVLMSLLTLFAAKSILSFIGYLGMGTKELLKMSPALGAAAKDVMAFAATWPMLSAAITGALAIGAAALAGFALGNWLYNNSVLARQFGVLLVTGFADAFARIQFYFGAFSDSFTAGMSNAFNFVIYTISNAVKKLLGIFGKMATAVGLDSLGAALTESAKTVEVQYQNIDASIAKRRKVLETDLARISDIRAEMMKDALLDPNAKAVKLPTRPDSPTPFPGVTDGKGGKGVTDGDIKKRETLIEQITRALDALNAKIDKSQTDLLKPQLDAIELEYNELKRKIGLVGGAAGKEFMEKLTKATDDLRDQVTRKFYKGLEDDFKGLTSELANAEAAAGRKNKASLEDRQAAIALSYTGLYQKIADIRDKYEKNGLTDGVANADKSKAALDSYVADLQALEKTKVAKEKLQQLEQSMNDLLKLRDAQVAAINAQKDAGNITDAAAADQINATNAKALPGIVAAGEATREWAKANREVFNSDGDRDTFLATLDSVIAKAGQVKTEFSSIGKVAMQGAIDGINTGLTAMIGNLQEVFNGQKNLATGFEGVLQAFGAFAVQFLQKIAVMIIQQAIFNAMANSGGGVGTLASIGKMALGVKHEGGVVGSNGQGNRTRSVETSWFANAPRYHTGGVPGLKSDEYATILQKGEEVLAANSPRNIMNGAATGGATKATDSQGIRVVMVDDRSKVHEAMASSDGERVIVQAIRRNITSVKQMVRG